MFRKALPLLLLFCAHLGAIYNPSWYALGLRTRNNCDCYETICAQPWGWGMQAEALWWRPCRGNMTIAEETFGAGGLVQKAKLRQVEPGYSWGVRASASYHPCDYCSFLQIAGLWYQSRDRGNATRSPDATFNVPGFSDLPDEFSISDGAIRNYYGMGALRLGFYPFKQHCSTLYMVGGARLFWIKERELIRAIQPVLVRSVSQLKRKHFFRGGAIELGIGGDVRFWRFWALRGHVLGLAAIAQRTTYYDREPIQELTIDGRRVRSPSPIVCVPGIDAKLGIAFVINACYFQLAAEIGYQIDYYIHAFEDVPLQAQDSSVTNETDTIRRPLNAGFGGPYAGVWFSF